MGALQESPGVPSKQALLRRETTFKEKAAVNLRIESQKTAKRFSEYAGCNAKLDFEEFLCMQPAAIRSRFTSNQIQIKTKSKSDQCQIQIQFQSTQNSIFVSPLMRKADEEPQNFPLMRKADEGSGNQNHINIKSR